MKLEKYLIFSYGLNFKGLLKRKKEKDWYGVRCYKEKLVEDIHIMEVLKINTKVLVERVYDAVYK